MTIIKNITIELRKLKSTSAFLFSIISGLFIPVIYFIYYFTKYQSLIPLEGVNPWDKFINDQFNNSAPFLLPILFILQTSLVVQIEHRIQGFKYVFAQPLSRWNIYLSKMMSVLLLILLSYTIFGLMLFISGNIVGLIHVELNFNEFIFPWFRILQFITITMIANLGIFAVQFWIAMRFKNFIIPIGIGLVLLITGLIIVRAEESIYFPYSYSIRSIINSSNSWFPNEVGWNSIIIFLVFTLIGCVETQRKNII